MEVNSYNANAAERTKSTKATTETGHKYQQTDDNTSLGINDFMKLLVAQLSHQDVMNPSTDTEFISQMAQFTSLKAMQTMADLGQTQYAASIVGKKVIVASYDQSGKFTQDTGIIERVKFVDGQSVITVNGVDYGLSSIMEVLSEGATTEKPEVKPEEKPEVKPETKP
ncbi:MAG: flagellar hook capping FlgD N-terminal domain-containing protein [Oscillospiraceae bacterium]